MRVMADQRDAGIRLKLARERAGFTTVREAADRFGWSPDTYAQHENGTRGIFRAASAYAKAFKVSQAWLLTGEGPGPKDDDPEIAQAINELLEIYRRLPIDRRRRLLDEARDQGRLGDLDREQSPKVPEDKAS